MEHNPTNPEIASQIKNALSFIQILYNESSYLIREIEGQLDKKDEGFQIVKPGGYSISARSSTNLEPINVNLWLLRKFAVAFIRKPNNKENKGQTSTQIDKNLKVIYYRIILEDNQYTEPAILYGTFYDIEVKKDNKAKKFENLMGYFEYIDSKLFSKMPNVEYEDSNIKIKGKFKKQNLLAINTSEELMKKVIEPSLEIYNDIQ